jgi:trehalose 6-phosphate phosphatase
MGGHTRRVSRGTADAAAELLAPLLEDPSRAAILFDVDGTVAPIAEHAEDARVPADCSRLLAQLARRYRVVGAVSGRPAADARRMVGVGSIDYAGMHGAERLPSGARAPQLRDDLAGWSERVSGFREQVDADFRQLRIRVEDKGPIVALHWRGADDEAAARRHLEAVAEAAAAAGLATHWGRKVLELRPPLEISKRLAVLELAGQAGIETALFGGDDTTDLDGFAALDELVADGRLKRGVRVAVASDEGPPQLVERADVVVDGVGGFREILAALAA